jgi:hypothetical protein
MADKLLPTISSGPVSDESTLLNVLFAGSSIDGESRALSTNLFACNFTNANLACSTVRATSHMSQEL